MTEEQEMKNKNHKQFWGWAFLNYKLGTLGIINDDNCLKIPYN